MSNRNHIDIQYSAKGATTQVTGSLHHVKIKIENKEYQFVVDYGMVQDSTKPITDVYRQNMEDRKIEWSKVDFIILTHLHNDHSGMLPRAVIDGFRGNIITTAPTAKLAEIIMYDGAKIMNKECKKYNRTAKGKKNLLYPIYLQKHVLDVMNYIKGYDYNKKIVINENVEIILKPCGHILGASSPYITIKNGENIKRILFTGDVSYGKTLPFTKTGSYKDLKVDYLITEGTYSDRVQKKTNVTTKLKKMVKDVCLENKGTLLIPAFSMGRSTVMLKHMFDIITNDEEFKDVDVYFASPMANKANRIHFQKDSFNFMDKKWSKYKNMLKLENFHWIEEYPILEKAVLNNNKPKVVIASAGSVDAGYSNAIAEKIVGSDKNGILYCGYKFQRSIGDRIWNTEKGEDIKIGESELERMCELDSVSLSGHSDWKQLIKTFKSMRHTKIKNIFITHGNLDGLNIFKEKLKEEFNAKVEVPEKYKWYKLN